MTYFQDMKEVGKSIVPIQQNDKSLLSAFSIQQQQCPNAGYRYIRGNRNG